MHNMREGSGLRGRVQSLSPDRNDPACGNTEEREIETSRDADDLAEAVRVCVDIADRYERGISLKEAVHQAEKARRDREKEK